MIGQRLRDGAPLADFAPGDYAWEPYALWEIPPPAHPDFSGEGEWWLKAPDGTMNAARHHTVTVHDDGTISCSPSLVFTSGWHGFLANGEWSP